MWFRFHQACNFPQQQQAATTASPAAVCPKLSHIATVVARSTVITMRLLPASLHLLLASVAVFNNYHHGLVEAATLTLTATKDNYFWEGAYSGNRGGYFVIALGRISDGTRHRSVVSFDLTRIPVGAQISKATMEFIVHETRDEIGDYVPCRNGGRPGCVTVHHLTQPWGEGTGVCCRSEAEHGDSAWGLAESPTDWDTPGGDFRSEVVGSLITSIGSGSSDRGKKAEFTLNIGWMQPFVEDVLAGQRPFHGFLLQDDDNPGNLDLYSKENGRSQPAPRLVIEYSVVPAATSAPTPRPTPHPTPEPTYRPTRVTTAPTHRLTPQPTSRVTTAPTSRVTTPVPTFRLTSGPTLSPSKSPNGITSTETPDDSPTSVVVTNNNNAIEACGMFRQQMVLETGLSATVQGQMETVFRQSVEAIEASMYLGSDGTDIVVTARSVSMSQQSEPGVVNTNSLMFPTNTSMTYTMCFTASEETNIPESIVVGYPADFLNYMVLRPSREALEDDLRDAGFAVQQGSLTPATLVEQSTTGINRNVDESGTGGGSSSTAVIAGSAGGALLFVAGLVVFVIMRRNKNNRPKVEAASASNRTRSTGNIHAEDFSHTEATPTGEPLSHDNTMDSATPVAVAVLESDDFYETPHDGYRLRHKDQGRSVSCEPRTNVATARARERRTSLASSDDSAIDA